MAVPTIYIMINCSALGCERTDVTIHRLKETSGFEFPAEAVLCPVHVAATSDSRHEWVYSPKGLPQTLVSGPDLHVLDEYVVEGLEASVSSGSISRVESPAVGDGYYLTLNARRRGEPAAHAMHLQVPHGQEKEIAKQLEDVADLLRSMPTSD